MTPGRAARSLGGPVLAVAVVALVVLLLVYLNGRPAPHGTPTVQPLPSLSQTGGSSASPARSASATSHPATSAPTATATRAAPPPSPQEVTRLPVTVLNNSRITGLAARAADQLRAAGWPVAMIGDFTGRLPSPTVYYDPGQEAVARALAAAFPKVERVLPRFPGLPGSGLTLVVTRQWAQ